MPPNRILSRLTPKDHALLRPHLEIIDLPCGTLLQVRNQRVEHVYFMETGVASVNSGSERQIEIAMIGYEGVSGVAAVLGNGLRVPYEIYVQIAGRGQRLAVRDLRAAMHASAGLTSVLLLCANDFMNQLAQAALANGLGSIEARVARWLLMAADRTNGTPLPVTHETLAAFLAVRRSGVSVVLGDLERQSLIARSRGAISIVDRKRLEGCSNGAYVRPKTEPT